MVQHVILAQLVPLPLALAAGGRRVRLPAPVAWFVGVGVMIVTSVPPVYLIAQGSATVDWAIRLALLAGGVVFWRPPFGARADARLAPGAALVYVITACFATTLAGMYIAFSAATADQQVAGLIMWVPCCVVYLSASLAIVVRAMSGTTNTKRHSFLHDYTTP
jgi:putative membrane protein